MLMTTAVRRGAGGRPPAIDELVDCVVGDKVGEDVGDEVGASVGDRVGVVVGAGRK